jgi:aspartate racemase
MRSHVEPAADRPVVSIIEATLAEVRRRKWQRVGVIALGDGAIYTEPLRGQGIACETTEAYQLASAVFGVMEGRIDDASRAIVRNSVEDLRRRNVDGIILGCTELPILLGAEADEASDLINSTQMLAEAAVDYAMR